MITVRGAGDCHDQDVSGGTCPTARTAHARRVATAWRTATKASAAVEPRRVGATAGSPGPGHASGGAGQDESGRPRADPIRAHGGLAVRVLPRRRGADGLGPRAHA